MRNGITINFSLRCGSTYKILSLELDHICCLVKEWHISIINGFDDMTLWFIVLYMYIFIYIFKICINVNIVVQYPSFIQSGMLAKHISVAENEEVQRLNTYSNRVSAEECIWQYEGNG